MQTELGEGFFAIDGRAALEWDLLVRNVGGASEALTTAPIHAPFEVEGPLGNGFSLDQAHGRHLIIAVVRSALIVARSIVRDRVAREMSSLTSVYIGARVIEDIPLAEEVASWKEAGVSIVPCLSGEASRASGGGRVQAVLERQIASGGRHMPKADTLIFAAGPEEMLSDLRAYAKRHGDDGDGRTIEVVTNT